MKYLYSFLLIILFFSSSCNKDKATQETSKKQDSLEIDSDRIVSKIGETLMPRAKEELEKWKEYNDVDEFILKFYNTSPFEALTNAKELSDLVKVMKDTIRIEKLKALNVVARFNVLHSETLRLEDMASISSIKKEEVKAEVIQILEVYSSLSSKINTIYKAEDLQSSLEIDTEKPISEEVKIINQKPTTQEISKLRSKRINKMD